jgi:hypothetical protein
MLVLASAVLSMQFIFSEEARAQGCLLARQSVPVLGPQTMNQSIDVCEGEPFFSARRLLITTGYRNQHSHRHFVGTVEQTVRADERTEVNNKTHIVDIAATYQINARWSTSFSIPLSYSDRFNQRTPDQVTHGRGIGDVNFGARMWVIKPPTESRQNLSIGFGFKLPTGKPGQTDTVTSATGTRTVIVDQSIQPGDGGYGFTLEASGYKSISFTTLYGSGIYLFNPRDTNGVRTGRGRASEAIMSVADQYLYRFGAIVPVPKLDFLSLSMGLRGEGIPVRDAFGKSGGFRRPGFALSMEPGLVLSVGQDQLSFSVPLAVHRDRKKSTSDIIDGRWGDAAFADHLLMVGYSRRF